MTDTPGISITHVILAAIHINPDPLAIHLNDHPPDHPRYASLWADIATLQSAGVKVLAMLGGAAPGTYARLAGPDDAAFDRYYIPLRNLLRRRALDGIDLDVEEPTSLADIVRLIDRLRADFGPEFLITLAPVAAALINHEANLSGFDYEALEVMRGPQIAWYNAQFYNGWGDMTNLFMYEMMLQKGWPVEKIVVGLVTSPDNGRGFVPFEFLSAVLRTLRARYRRFAGVMGWEYFNSLPGGVDRPWEWAREITDVLRKQYLMPAAPVGAVKVDGSGDLDPDQPGDPVEVPKPFNYYSDDQPE
ncbi:Chitinase 2 [Escovopsis weberi]|uniref:Chitinase 2 n=1 Tax=Escovopsis weberi TaxID=150374 RepID=A0A0M9VS23_ESCWE|nr:Chitinase 2 [Escovopsis weberi]